MKREKKVLLLLHKGFEELEAIAPLDILRRGEIDVIAAAVGKEQSVLGAHQIEIKADRQLLDIKNFNDFNALVIPGGPGIFEIRTNQKILQCIQQFHAQKKLIGAICAAPLLLKDAGILPPSYTAYPSTKDELPNLQLQTPVVKFQDQNGIILTSQGPGTATEFAFALLELLQSKEVTLALRKGMCFNF